MAVYGSPAHPKNKLKEGDAVGDLLKPDCFTIGMNNTANCDRAGALLRELHEPFNRNHGCTLFMDVRSLELTEAMGQADAKVQTFDSVGRKEAERTYGTKSSLTLCSDKYAALQVVEMETRMAGKVIVDGRNLDRPRKCQQKGGSACRWGEHRRRYEKLLLGH